MRTLYLGDEAVLHCDEFSLESPGMKAVRTAVKHVGKDHDFELIAETEASPELIAELNEISAEWREGSPERGFTMELGEEVEGVNGDFVLAVAHEKGGRVAGFLRFVPVYGERPGYSLDLMRRRPDSANGLTEYLIAEAALALGSRGFKRLSLNFAAWGRLLDSAEDAGLSGRVQRLMAKGLNPFFQIQSLRDFNQKFGPEWVPRSIVIDDVSDMPRVAMLYASVEGFLEVPGLSRVLEPPIRQRVDAADPPAPEPPALLRRHQLDRDEEQDVDAEPEHGAELRLDEGEDAGDEDRDQERPREPLVGAQAIAAQQPLEADDDQHGGDRGRADAGPVDEAEVAKESLSKPWRAASSANPIEKTSPARARNEARAQIAKTATTTPWNQRCSVQRS